MTKYLQFLGFCSQAVLLTVFLLSASGMAAQTAPLPDMAAPSYHPGLFTHISPEPANIPPVVNTYEGAGNEFAYMSPSVSYSFFPGNREKGELPSIIGYISGSIPNSAVNISGRLNQTEQFQYLATALPDNRGIFVWTVPELALNLTEFIVEIAQ